MSMGSRSGGAEVIQVVPGTGRLWDDDTPTCGNTCRWETRRGYGAYRVACFVLPVLFFLTTAHMCSIVAAMSCHLLILDAVRRVLAWRQLLPPTNPGTPVAPCSIL